MNYGYDSYDSSVAGLLGGLTVVVIILGLLLLTWAIFNIIALWKVYKKAGKNGWECIVPFYGYWVLVEIAGLNWWWFLLAMINSVVSLLELDDLSAIANLISLFASFNIYYNIAKKFNKSNGTAVCAGLFSGIFVLIFGFSKDAVYDINIPVSKNGIFGSPEITNTGVASNMNTTNYEQSVQDNNLNSSMQTINNSNANGVQMQQFSYCGNCGTKLNKDVRFCPNCGRENK